MSLAIGYILICVIAGVIGQILLKKGMTNIGPVTVSPDQLPGLLWRLATNPFVVVGLIVYVCGTIFWLAALSRVDLSYAYAFAGLNFLFMLAVSWLLFRENISPVRLVGTLIVALGVFIVSRS